jgi:hypothetical protein
MRVITDKTIFDRTEWVVVRPQKGSYLFYNSRTLYAALVLFPCIELRGKVDVPMTRSDIADYLGVGEPNNQAVFRTKLTPKNDRFQGHALAPDESKYEKPEIGPFRETAVCAHFGRKLQKIFPLPAI